MKDNPWPFCISSRFRWGLGFLLALFFLSACNSQNRLNQKRKEAAADPQQSAVIGFVDSSKTPSGFLQGCQVGLEELNQSHQLSKRLEGRFLDDQGQSTKAKALARELSSDPAVVAVIGHMVSEAAVAASLVYEQKQLLNLNPGATQTDLIRQENLYVLRSVPNDKAYAQAVAQQMKRAGVASLALVYERDFEHRRNAELVQKNALSQGIKVAATRSYSSWETDFRAMLADLKQASFQAIYLSGSFPRVNDLIQQLRKMGLNQPVFGSNSLDSQLLIDGAGKAAEGVETPGLFNPKRQSNLTRSFAQRYSQRFGLPPDTWAAQCYDALQLLAQAIGQTSSYDPTVLASSLRFAEPWEGAAGPLAPGQDGEIKPRPFVFKRVQGGEFVYLEDQGPKEVRLFESIREETLTLAYDQEIQSLDPARVRPGIEQEIAGQMFLPLVAMSGEMESPLGLAAKLHQPSPTELVVELKPDLQWSDGRPLTANDLVASLKRNLELRPAAEGLRYLFLLKNAQEYHQGSLTDFGQVGVKALSPLALRFSLLRPRRDFARLLSLPVFWPLPLGDAKNPQGWSPQAGSGVVSGPYRLVQQHPRLLSILQRNPKFPEGAQKPIREIRYRYLNHPRLAYELYRGQGVDLLDSGLAQFDLERWSKEANQNLEIKKASHHLAGAQKLVYLQASSQPPTDQLAVRQAISLALDRRLIAKLMTQGLDFPLESWPKPTASQTGLAFDPQRAAQLLAQARTNPQGQVQRLRVGAFPDPASQRIAQGVKDSLEHYLPLQVDLVTLELGQARPKDLNLVPLLLQPSYQSDWADWDALQQALTGLEPALAQPLLEQVEQLLQGGQGAANPSAQSNPGAESHQILPLLHQGRILLVHPRVGHWSFQQLGSQSLAHWELQPEKSNP